MSGERACLSLLNVGNGSIQGDMAGIGLWRGCHEDCGISQRDSGLRHSKHKGHIHAGFDNGDDHGIGQAHILRRNDHQSAAGGLHLPCLQKPGKVVAGRIRIRAANGFLQRGKKVIVVVPIPVCPHGAFLGHGYGIGHSQRQRIPLGHGCGEQDLNGVHGFAQIAAAGPCNIVKNPILRHGFQTGALFHKGDRPLQPLSAPPPW